MGIQLFGFHILVAGPPEQDNHVVEHNTASIEEPNGEVVTPAENGDVAVVEEEEVPVAEVVNEVEEDSHVAVESNNKVEEVPKKLYSQIVSV